LSNNVRGPALTAKTPASEPKFPPQINAAGSDEATVLAWSAQSATHPSTFPTIHGVTAG